jgi:DNA-binding transcriptional regulator of glucitol operon
VSKRFQTFEHQGFTFSGNFFNIFNHTNFNNPVIDANSSEYGKSISDAGPRVTQLSLRYDF